MKRAIMFLIVIGLISTAFLGCAPQENHNEDENPPVRTENKDGNAKLGFAVMSSIGKSESATADKTGLGRTDSTVIAVLTDADGRIIKCIIDAVQCAVNFTNTGEIASDITPEVKTKLELGEEYGMKSQSKIGKEWNEQAAAFASYVEGKTIEQVKGIAINESGVTTNPELNTQVTISIRGFIDAVEKAVNNATDLGAAPDDELGLGVVTNIAKSTNAVAGDNGLIRAYSNYAVAAFNSDGKITSCIIDASETDINFNVAGEIVSDLNAEFRTKQEIANEYGMKSQSGIGKEWFEQANAFAEYAKGKTVDEIKGISIDEEGHATDEAITTSSVTISVADAIRTIEKAYNGRK